MVTATLEKPISREEDMKMCHHCRVRKSIQKINLWDSELEILYNSETCDNQAK